MMIELDNASKDIAETVAKLIKQKNFQQAVPYPRLKVLSSAPHDNGGS
ncbi:MAG: hypothetical protein WCF61_07480 [Terriglobales bacterium]|jgi:hypothetical protein